MRTGFCIGIVIALMREYVDHAVLTLRKKSHGGGQARAGRIPRFLTPHLNIRLTMTVGGILSNLGPQHNVSRLRVKARQLEAPKLDSLTVA